MRPPSQTHDLSDVAQTTSSTESPPVVQQRPRAVTQKQIAERVGVTQQLVALALKDSPNVAVATRDKIRAVARDMGYNPNANHHARSLAAARHGTSVRSNVIAVVFEMTAAVSAMGTPYFMPLMDGIEIEAGERQLDLLLVRRNPSGLPWLLRDGWVDGVILLGSHTSAGEVGQLGIPVVTLGAYLPEFPGITPQDEEGTYAATNHLISLGHRRIAYLGPIPSWPSSTSRILGYHKALTEAGIEIDETLEEITLPEPLEPDGTAGMTRLLARTSSKGASFTALVCHNDSIAMAAIRVAREHGRSVPNDLSVTGFDDISGDSGFSPLITSVGFSSLDMGRSAVRMLMTPVSDTSSPPRHDEFPVSLRVRQSTGPAATSS